jgi:hypothetical protein
VRQRRQAGVVQGGEEKAGGNAHRFRHVIVAELVALGINAVLLRKDGDEHRRGFQERLAGIGAQRRQRLQPLLRRALGIELTLFGFGRFAQALFVCRLGDDAEKPRLLVRARRRAAGAAQAIVNHLTRHSAAVEVTHGAAAAHVGVEVMCTLQHLGGRVLAIVGKRFMRGSGAHWFSRQMGCDA